MSIPKNYELALSVRPDLLARFESTKQSLISQGFGASLQSFLHFLQRGSAAINMPVSKLNQFLKHGRWLNIYELTAHQTGNSNPSPEEVRQRIPDFYDRRRAVDEFFCFGPEIHYASLHMGGCGPNEKYGCCCVVFDLKHWAPYHTCFFGDSILACFGTDGSNRIAKTVLDRFGVGEDAPKLAAMHQIEEVQQSAPMQVKHLQALFEGRRTLVELHLPGEISRDHIHKVLISYRGYSELKSLSHQHQKSHSKSSLEFDEVPAFLEMHELLDRYQIPFFRYP